MRESKFTLSYLKFVIQKSFSNIPIKTWALHILLFILTFFTMSLVYQSTSNGLYYSIPLLIILLSHELGHYIPAKIYNIKTTLPYFIPMPFINYFGTMGAFIKMKSPPQNERVLFDISFWGPAMSFITSLIFTIIGLLKSSIINSQLLQMGGISFGDSLIYKFLVYTCMKVPNGYEVLVHPMAFAGWVGFFITGINLMPIGQLDGGHIAYSIIKDKQKYFAYLFLAFLIGLSFIFQGWILWILLLIVFIKPIHPPTHFSSDLQVDFIDGEYIAFAPPQIDIKRKRLSIIALIMFILTFVPIPISEYPPKKTTPPLKIEKELQHVEKWNI